ncbi:MAG: hypothetical protein V4615_04540 [Bacteroidota bacterium]
MTDTELEKKVINKFIIKNKRDRYLGFIQNDKTRKKFLDDLSHGQMFQADLFESITEHESEVIKKISLKLGVKDCYIISENEKLDGKRLDIDTALNEAISPWSDISTIIVFGDGQVIYREHDGAKNRWISKY